MEVELTNYWSERKHLSYYRTALRYVRQYTLPGALLDVGSGIQRGCTYLEWLPEYDRTALELPPDDGHRLAGVDQQFGDFLTWIPSRTQYDVVLCLQTVEHCPDPSLFVSKLLCLAPVLVLSVPYRWPKGRCAEHLHDPIDEEKLRAWVRKDPTEHKIVDRRLVAVYATSSQASEA